MIACHFRLALLNKLLEDGNTLYKLNKLNDAAMFYAYALKRIPDATQLPPKHAKVFGQLRVHLLLNQSRCKRRLKAFSEAVDLATVVIKMLPHQFEAYYARAKARHSAGQLEAAYADLTAAVRLAPASRELNQILINLKEEISSTNSSKSQQQHPQQLTEVVCCTVRIERNMVEEPTSSLFDRRLLILLISVIILFTFSA